MFAWFMKGIAKKDKFDSIFHLSRTLLVMRERERREGGREGGRERERERETFLLKKVTSDRKSDNEFF